MTYDLLRERPSVGFARFLERCATLPGVDIALVERLSVATMKMLNSKQVDRNVLLPSQALEQRWYASLERGEPDYGVYDTQEFLAELWPCWVVYSRKYILSLLQEKSFPPRGVFSSLEPFARIVDLGCGIGHTTAAFRILYPDAEVIGTNFPNHLQTLYAQMLIDEYEFKIARDVAAIRGATDLVFASEYFEHIEDPVAHLHEVIDALQPRVLVFANAFGARALGHFDKYRHGVRVIDGKTVGRFFLKHLRALGYAKLPTSLYNNRPSVYVRLPWSRYF